MAVGVAVVVALVAGVWWLLSKDSIAKGSDIAAVLGLPVALLSLGAAVIAAVGAFRAGGAEDTTLLGAARQLAGAVRVQESAALARLVADTGDTRPADVGFAQPGLLYWRSDGGARRGSLAQIESFYRELGRGRLVVLGQAGAGKTVLVIQLIRDLAGAIVDTAAAAGGRVVVPVRLSLPAFDPAVGDDQLDEVTGEDLAERLDQWVAGHLVTVHGLRETVAAALVREGWVLPVLDGLDEMDPGEQWPRRAAAVVRAVNHPTAYGLRPMVLTCRTGRYAQLTGHPLGHGEAAAGSATVRAANGESVVVQDATVVGIEPLAVDDVSAYLSYRFPDPTGSERCEPRWAPVIQRLDANRAGDPVVASLRSPLRLFLTVTGYRHADRDPGVLTQYDTTAQLDDHLFRMFVPAVTAAHPRPTGGHYPAADVQRWLTTLARHLHHQGAADKSSTDLRLDELWPAAGDHAPRYLTAALLNIAQLTLLTSFLSFYPPVELSWDLPAALFGAGLLGLVIGTSWGSSRRSAELARIDLGALRTPAGRRRFAGRLSAWLVGVGVVWLAVWFTGVLAARFMSVLAGGFVAGLVAGLTAELTARPVAIDRPRRVVSQGLAHTAVLFAVWLVGLVAVLLAGLAAGFTGVLTGVLTFGLTFGSMLGIFYVRRSPWPRYAVACLLLAQRGELPRRPAVLLDWAYDAGLVRLSGIAVQFRHREFQDWLTTTHDQETAPTAVPPPSTTAGTTAPVGGE